MFEISFRDMRKKRVLQGAIQGSVLSWIKFSGAANGSLDQRINGSLDLNLHLFIPVQIDFSK